MTEADWQRTVIEAAQRFGWKVAHFRPAKTEKGWRTAVAADGKGFPDLVLVRDRVLFVELKTDRGRLLDDQRDWERAIAGALDRWLDHPGTMLVDGLMPFDHEVWRPGDWPRVEMVLRGL